MAKQKKPVKDIYFESYSRFATRLRNWYIAYGIGAPALILTQEHLWAELSYPTVKTILILFLGGIFLQIVYSIIHKWSQWKIYCCTKCDDENENKHLHKEDCCYYWARLLDRSYWIDNIADFGTLFAFAAATWTLLNAIPNSDNEQQSAITTRQSVIIIDE